MNKILYRKLDTPKVEILSSSLPSTSTAGSSKTSTINETSLNNSGSSNSPVLIKCCAKSRNMPSSSLNPCQCHMCFPTLNSSTKADRKTNIKLMEMKNENKNIIQNISTALNLPSVSRVHSESSRSDQSSIRYGSQII